MASNHTGKGPTHRLHRAGVVGSHLKPLAFGDFIKLRREDIAVFAAAAEVFDHIVIVRATNEKSLPYIGRKHFAPKPIDCKPKTADDDCYVQEHNTFVACAGLVVDPTLVSHAAFASEARRRKARHAWFDFLANKTGEETRRKVFRRRASKGFYAVDTLPTSRRYGCLMLSNQDVPAEDFDLSDRNWGRFKNINMRYIHGDYDLYGLIDLAGIGTPAARRPKVLEEKLHGTRHLYTEKFLPIKEFLNNGFGAEMIQHAAQDHVAHQGDLLYIFYPDGQMYQVDANTHTIRELYEVLFHQEVTT